MTKEDAIKKACELAGSIAITGNYDGSPVNFDVMKQLNELCDKYDIFMCDDEAGIEIEDDIFYFARETL